MRNNLLDFNEVNYGDLPIVGAKAYHLAKLFKKNFPVPQGFVLTTNCFQQFLKSNFFDFLHKSLTKDISLIDSFFIASDLKDKIIKGNISKQIKKSISNKIDKFAFSTLSVRSSATIEDGISGSFAGQFESYLNVNKKDVWKKILLCWASLFSRRVIIYSRKKNIAINKVQMAVMVHQMVTPESAGNIFTVDVANRNRHFILIEAVRGGGHRVTDGTGSVEKILVNRDDLSLANKSNDIDKGLIKVLARIALKIEKFFHYPQDIEWALQKGKIYILQSRPLTIYNVNK